MSAPSDVTALLSAWRGGSDDALKRLIPIVYDELRRIAAQHMRREQTGHTLQTTALVNEAYIRLAKEQNRTWENRAHFFAVAAQIMRNLLVDHARAKARVKRGAGEVKVALDDIADFAADPAEVIALDQALTRLAQMDPRASHIVELRYFVGLTAEEVAVILDVSEKTVKREWAAAKAWLQTALRADD